MDHGVKTVKSTLLEAVEKRFSDVELEPLYCLATILDNDNNIIIIIIIIIIIRLYIITGYNLSFFCLFNKKVQGSIFLQHSQTYSTRNASKGVSNRNRRTEGRDKVR